MRGARTHPAAVLRAVTGYVPLTPALMVSAAPDTAAWIYPAVIFFVVPAVAPTAAVVQTRNAFRQEAATAVSPAAGTAEPAR